MITDNCTIQFKTIAESPKYDETTKMIKIDKVIIVKQGMKSGMPSVDIQCLDEEGNKYLIFATGGIMSMIGSAIGSKEAKQ